VEEVGETVKMRFVAIMTIAPPPALSSAGTAATADSQVPFTFTAITRSQSLGSI
jgi:hypothetical protein